MRTVFNVLIVYAVLVGAGGTLIQLDHPIAFEVGQIMHLVTFVDPAITWADGHGLEPIATGLRVLSGGVPLG